MTSFHIKAFTGDISLTSFKKDPSIVKEKEKEEQTEKAKNKKNISRIED